MEDFPINAESNRQSSIKVPKNIKRPATPVKVECGITDEQLAEMSARELNKILRSKKLTRKDVLLIKQR